MTRAYPRMKEVAVELAGGDKELCIGCYTKDGGIVPDLSPKLLFENCPAGAYSAFFAESAGKYVVCAEDGVYYTAGNRFVKSNTTAQFVKPFCFRTGGKNAEWYLAGGNNCLRIGRDTHAQKELKYGIFGGVDKNGRLFCIDSDDRSCLRWSGEGGGTDWEESISGAGWAHICRERGNILNLAVYKQRIAVICEYGLALLSAYGAPENFKITYPDAKTDRIIADTCAEADGELVFFTEKGLCAYDGVRVKTLDIVVAKDAVNPRGALSFGGRYFVIAESKRLQRTVIFVLLIGDRRGYIVDLPALAMCLNGEVICFTDNATYALETGGEFTYTGGKADFGTTDRKCLKSVHLGNCAPVEIKVENGVDSRILTGVSGYCRINMRGAEFEITLKSTQKITGLKLIAEVAD